MGQVLSGSNKYGNDNGVGVFVGSQYTLGRTFGRLNEQTYNRQSVTPDSYRRQLFNPVFGIAWWSEYPVGNLSIGCKVSGSFSSEKYQVELGSENLTGKSQFVGLNVCAYLGLPFADRLTGGVGVWLDEQVPCSDKGKLSIFSSHNNIGLEAMVRYAFAESFFVSLQADYALLQFDGLGGGEERYSSIGTKGYYVVESDAKQFAVLVGIGTSF